MDGVMLFIHWKHSNSVVYLIANILKLRQYIRRHCADSHKDIWLVLTTHWTKQRESNKGIKFTETIRLSSSTVCHFWRSQSHDNPPSYYYTINVYKNHILWKNIGAIKTASYHHTHTHLQNSYSFIWWNSATVNIYADNAHSRIASRIRGFVNSRQKLCLTSELLLLVGGWIHVPYFHFISCVICEEISRERKITQPENYNWMRCNEWAKVWLREAKIWHFQNEKCSANIYMRAREREKAEKIHVC